MSTPASLLLGLILGGLIGFLSTYLYLMNRLTGRKIDWFAVRTGFFLAMAASFFLVLIFWM
jgi:hypothetical protein